MDLEEEEMLCCNDGGTREDNQFDAIVGALEDIIMEPEFARRQAEFFRRHSVHFDDSEENKLIYTQLFEEYHTQLERVIESRLCAAVPGFSMSEFMGMLETRQDELFGDVFDLLHSLSDFDEFKGMMLAHRPVSSSLAAAGAGGAPGDAPALSRSRSGSGPGGAAGACGGADAPAYAAMSPSVRRLTHR